ncbi:unnamed protein product, partial [Mesorhabditis belari]|uniref:Potassium channel domain-containing protein n=1 Tax=Mesorhabditis belari TaxID=2138241 RepID=A0AAF3EET3_9BILA
MVQDLHTYSVAAVDFLNRMVIARVRESASKAFSTSPKIRRFTPILLFVAALLYIFFGGCVFFFFENDRQHEAFRQWYRNSNNIKSHQAKLMSKRIFNDTQNLLIIIDKDQSERVEKILLNQLKSSYDGRMNIHPPNKTSWNFLNSINFAYSAVLSVGQGAKIPESVLGQLFLIPYLTIGIPLIFFTLGSIVHQFVLPFMNRSEFPFTRRFAALALAVSIYFVWAILVSFYLYFEVFDNYLTSLITALFTMTTVQVTHSSLTECHTFVLLLLTTISLSIALLIAFLTLACYGDYGIAVSQEIPEEVNGESTSANGQQRFTVVVDQAGDSKLASN